MQRFTPSRPSIAIILVLMLAVCAVTTIEAVDDPRLVATGAWNMIVSPDSTTIVYVRGGGPDMPAEIWRVPITGGTPVSLNSSIAIPFGIPVQDMRITANNQWVVYLGRQKDGGDQPALYSVPLAGGTPVRLSHPPVDPMTDSIVEFSLSPDSTHVTYITERDSSPQIYDELRTLHSVPIDGSRSAVQLNPDLTGTQRVESAMISPDSSRVIFNVAEHSYQNTVYTFYSSAINEDNRLLVDGPVMRTARHRVSPDGTYILYAQYDPETNSSGLYKTSTTNGQRVRLNTPEDKPVYFYEISPDSNAIVFLSGDPATGPQALYSLTRVPTSTPILLSRNIPATGISGLPFFTSDSERVIFQGSDAETGRVGLFSVPTFGGSVAKLNGPPSSSTTSIYRITSVVLSPADDYVVYMVVESEGWPKMFRARVDGTTSALRIGADEILSGSCIESDIHFTPNGKYVLYRSLRIGENEYFEKTYDLNLTSLATGQSVKLNGSTGIVWPDSSDCSTRSFVISPDSNYVFFADERAHLYALDISNPSLIPTPPSQPKHYDIFLPLVGRQ